MSMKSEEDVNKQFIQRSGVDHNGQRVVYVGNTDNIDPYFDELTDVIFAIQQFIVSRKSITQRSGHRKQVLHRRAQKVCV